MKYWLENYSALQNHDLKACTIPIDTEIHPNETCQVSGQVGTACLFIKCVFKRLNPDESSTWVAYEIFIDKHLAKNRYVHDELFKERYDVLKVTEPDPGQYFQVESRYKITWGYIEPPK